MKKIIFLVAIATLLSYASIGQNTKLGFRAGMSASNLKAKTSGYTISLDTKIGFYVGALAEFEIANDLAFEPELNFMQMGAKVNMAVEDFALSGTTESGYLQLPLLFKYRNSGFSAFAGPQIGYLLYAKDKMQGTTTDSKDSYKTMEFAGILGVGYTLESGIGFDARYHMGISNIARKSEESDGEGTVKNHAFTVGVHYFFNRK